MTVDQTIAVRDLCAQLAINPVDVAKLELTPRKVTVTVYRRNEDGKKYVGDDGEPAVDIHHHAGTYQE